jgi:hypothetical protein
MAPPALPTRREVLRSFAYAAVAISRPPSAPALVYRISVRPAKAVLGERVVAVLSCSALRAVADAFTFDDASLTLSLARRPARAEPEEAFPNHWAIQHGDLLVRRSTGEHRVSLKPGATLHRELDLFDLYPDEVLDIGDFKLSYEFDGERVHARPASLTITSGSAAVGNLLALLVHSSAAVRERAARLLHRMTGHTVGYLANAEPAERERTAERWRAWWASTGTKLPWAQSAAGATFGRTLAATPLPDTNRSTRGKSLGGIAYTRKTLDGRDEAAIASALGTWLQGPSTGAAALKGRTHVADQVVAYPPDGVLLEPTGDTLSKLTQALTSLAARAATMTPEVVGAAVVLDTVAKMPSPAMLEPLAALRRATAERPPWSVASALAEGLLDCMDPARTPVGPP